jgi:hypothetical protein
MEENRIEIDKAGHQPLSNVSLWSRIVSIIEGNMTVGKIFTHR